MAIARSRTLFPSFSQQVWNWFNLSEETEEEVLVFERFQYSQQVFRKLFPATLN